MQRWIITGGFAAILAAALLFALACTGSRSVSTEDIDAILDPLNQRLDEATFVPAVSREEVVQRALESTGALLGNTDTSTLETRATVGLYTGIDNRGEHVKERRVWLVVVDDLPMTVPSGPYTSPENRVDPSGQRQQNQLVIFFDADTGEEIEDSISGRWVEKENP